MPLVRWLFLVCFEWGVIILCATAALMSPLLWPAAWLIIGTRQHALLVLGHEAVHRTLIGNRTVSDCVANMLTFWPCGVDIPTFRRFHLEHHRTVGTPLDPEKGPLSAYPDHWRNLTSSKRARLIGLDLFGLTLREQLIVSGVAHGPGSALRLAYSAAIVGVLSYLQLWPLLLLWLLCLFTVAFACMRARIWREHIGAGKLVTHRYQAKLWERMTYLPHNIWRHWDHHRRGRWSVPWYRLRP